MVGNQLKTRKEDTKTGMQIEILKDQLKTKTLQKKVREYGVRDPGGNSVGERGGGPLPKKTTARLTLIGKFGDIKSSRVGPFRERDSGQKQKESPKIKKRRLETRGIQ